MKKTQMKTYLVITTENWISEIQAETEKDAIEKANEGDEGENRVLQVFNVEYAIERDEQRISRRMKNE